MPISCGVPNTAEPLPWTQFNLTKPKHTHVILPLLFLFIYLSRDHDMKAIFLSDPVMVDQVVGRGERYPKLFVPAAWTLHARNNVKIIIFPT